MVYEASDISCNMNGRLVKKPSGPGKQSMFEQFVAHDTDFSAILQKGGLYQRLEFIMDSQVVNGKSLPFMKLIISQISLNPNHIYMNVRSAGLLGQTENKLLQKFKPLIINLMQKGFNMKFQQIFNKISQEM